ncbi:MAG: ABC transporter ATP-binding protein [Acetivibrionales bacterium]|jgi:iron complex transport system ATP-binding protein|nr:ABC transporter ATP-binding protein [Clostridiaceae bacterium]
MLEVDSLSVKIGERKIVDNVSFVLKEHDILIVMGPNGAGKTTLFKAIMGIIPHEGKALLDKSDIKTFSTRELAKKIGVLTQKHQPRFAHSVYDVVSLGRYAYQKGLFASLDKNDKKKIDDALKLTGIYDIKNQSVLTLSGGELQRTFLAQLFAQEPKILILDEPTNHLDLQYQIAIFDIIREWVKQDNRAVMAAVHDINTAYSYGNRAILMNEGKVHVQGSVEQVLDREHLKAVYKVDVVDWMQSLLRYWDLQ